MDPVFLSSIGPLSGSRANEAASAQSSDIAAGNSVGSGLGESFSDVMAQSATGFVETIQKAEATSIAGIKGEAGVYEVAMSVMEAEQQLRVATAIRDRVIQAFQELSRMQI